jgi:PKD repeat protein
MPNTYRLAALAGYALLQVGCGGGGGGSSASATSALPPVAAETASVTQGVAPLTVILSASGSTDPQGYSLSYSWNFGDGDIPPLLSSRRV